MHGADSADRPVDRDDRVLVGRIARTHGNRGEVIVNLDTDFPDARFRQGATLFARTAAGREETIEVTSVRFHAGRPILGLAGVASIGEAERFAGTELWVPASEQHALPLGVYYHHQLVGCDVVTETGERVGRVTTVEGEMEASRLVVRGARGEVLIPLASDICRVDVGARRIVVTPPEGLLELNGDFR
jgi:16S rRNA processing protein RimM